MPKIRIKIERGQKILFLVAFKAWITSFISLPTECKIDLLQTVSECATLNLSILQL